MTPPLRESPRPPRSAFWPAALLGAALMAAKAAYLGRPDSFSPSDLAGRLHTFAIISHEDLLFAIAVGLLAAGGLRLARARPRIEGAAFFLFLLLAAAAVLYAVMNLRIFAFFRAPLTYPLLYMGGDLRSLRSSIGAFLTAPLLAAMVLAPALYLLLAIALAPRPRPRAAVLVLAVLALAAFVGYGRAHAPERRERGDWRIAQSPHRVLLASCAAELAGGRTVLLAERFAPEDEDDFRTVAERPAARDSGPDAAALPRPRNVILIVLESTAARYLTVYGSPYDTTPKLAAEAQSCLVFDNYYAHAGHTASALVAIALSIYPGLTWRDLTYDHPRLSGTSLADVLRGRGCRTAFITSSDLDWANSRAFLAGRGFDEVHDMSDVDCGEPLSSWGVEDRCMVDATLRFIDRERGRPFFVMGWTDQTHHPYEPARGQEPIDFFRGKKLPPDDYELGRYLNVLHEVDRHLGRLFEGLRERGLADDTLVVVTGDHGECFGDPHDAYGHGTTTFEEGLHVPLILWNPRLYAPGGRAGALGGQVDLGPTVLDVLGIHPGAVPGSWQGRSLFERGRPGRVYSYVACDDYLFAVREGSWKYTFDAMRGRERLYDLEGDPTEAKDVAAGNAERCRRFRQRLAAWVAYESRHMAALFAEERAAE